MLKVSRTLAISVSCARVLASVKLSYLLPAAVRHADSERAKLASSVLPFREPQLPLSFRNSRCAGSCGRHVRRVVRVSRKQSNNPLVHVRHPMRRPISLSVVFVRGQRNHVQAVPLHKPVPSSQGSDELRVRAFDGLTFPNPASGCYVEICCVELCGNDVKLFYLLKSMGRWLIIARVRALGHAFLSLSTYLAPVHARWGGFTGRVAFASPGTFA